MSSVGSYDRSTGKIVDNTGETTKQKIQRQQDAQQGIGSYRDSDKSSSVYRDSKGQIVERSTGVVIVDSSGKPTGDKVHPAENLQWTGMGGTLSPQQEKLIIQQDLESRTIENRAMQIKEELRRQELQRQKELEELRKRQQELEALEKKSKETKKQVVPKSPSWFPAGLQHGAYLVDVPKYPNASQQVQNKKQEITQIEKRQKDRDKIVSDLQGILKGTQRGEYITKQQNLDTGDSSVRGKKPPVQVGSLLYGASMFAKEPSDVETKIEQGVQQQFGGVTYDYPQKPPTPPKEFKGLIFTPSSFSQSKEIVETPEGTFEKTTTTPPFTFISSGKQDKLRDTWMPRYIEKGSVYYQQGGIGKDYFGGKEPSQSKSPINVGGVPIEAPQPSVESNRGIAGAMSPLENIYTLGEYSVKGGAKDIGYVASGQFEKAGKTEPPPLKKDILITPIEILTHPADSVQDYISNVGKGFGKLGKDIQDDPRYWTANIGTNIELAVASVGIEPLARSVLTPIRTKMSQSKAMGYLEFLHPPQREVIEIWKPTGKVTKTQSGLEVLEYKLMRETKPEIETVKTQKPKQTHDPDIVGGVEIAGVEQLGTRTQVKSPIESFEKAGKKYGYDVYEFTFREGSEIRKGTITMTPNPLVEYFKPSKPIDIPKPKASERVLQLDIETGKKIQAEIAQNPSKSLEIFTKYAIKGEGGQYVSKSTLPKDFYLADVETGKIRKVSPQTAEWLGARGKEVVQSEQFSFSELYGKMYDWQDPQLLNKYQKGLVGDLGAKNWQKSRYSLDLNYYSPEFGGSSFGTELPTTPRGTKYDKRKDPTGKDLPPLTSSKPEDYLVLGDVSPQFSKITALEAKLIGKYPDFFEFDTASGRFYPKNPPTQKKPPKPFSYDDNLPTAEQILAKEEKEIFKELIGTSFGQETKSTAKPITPLWQDTEEVTRTKDVYGFAMVDAYPIVYPPSQQEKTKDLFGLDDMLKQFEFTDQMPELDTAVIPRQSQKSRPDTTSKQKPLIDQTPIVSPLVDVDIGFTFRQDEDTPLITEETPIFEPPPEIVTEVPTGRPPPPIIPPFEFGFAFPFGDESDWFYPKKSKTGGKEPRFWNVDPENVLTYFPSRLGYQRKEFKQVSSKKGRGKRTDFGGYDTIGDLSKIGF